MKGKPGRGVDPRVGHVVPVTDVTDPEPLVGACLFLDGEEIPQDLAGVEKVGEAVDDGNGGFPGELFDEVLAEGPDDNAVEIPGHDPGGVGDRFPRPS